MKTNYSLHLFAALLLLSCHRPNCPALFCSITSTNEEVNVSSSEVDSFVLGDTVSIERNKYIKDSEWTIFEQGKIQNDTSIVRPENFFPSEIRRAIVKKRVC